MLKLRRFPLFLYQNWQQFRQRSANHQIFSAAIVVAIATLVVKLGGMLKELVVAWRFGTGDDLDAFLIALVIPSFLVNVIAGSFSYVLVPSYIQVREQQGAIAAQKLLSGASLWSFGLLLLTTIIMLITAPLYLPLLAAGFSLAKLHLTYQLLYAIAPMVLFSGILTVWAAVLNAGERFALAALTPLSTSAAIVLLLFGFQAWGVFALAGGLVLGTFLEGLLLGWALYRQGLTPIPRWYGMNEALAQIMRQYAPTIAGSMLMCSANLVDQAMAAMLLPGSVAALNYGNRIVALPLGLVTTALGTAVAPYLAKMVAQNNWRGAQHTFNHYLKLIFAVTVPCMVGLIWLSEPIIRSLFQRGSFSAADTQIVSQIQIAFALQIPFYIASVFTVRLVSALQINHLLMWGSAINLTANILFNYLFSKVIGIAGIALSTSGVYFISFLFLWIMTQKHLTRYIQMGQAPTSTH
ncbi:MAG: murein biosynthesis integral membrane protein MurJ [Synechococcales bacterium]|nr:murein biosynthesis integral membrane protein MurJ [Synechococcales bacterium]